MNNGLVSSWMSTPVKTVTPKTYIVDARRIMNAEKIRALPVVQDEQLVGIITWRGLLRTDMPVLHGQLCSDRISLQEKRVEDIMTVNPIGVLPNTLMPKAARMLLENKITALPVLNNQRSVQGIVTTSDIFRFILEELPGLKHPVVVGDYMSHEVVTIEPETTLLDAQRQMATKRIRALPVLQDEQLVGLVTRTDMMRVAPSRFLSYHHQEQTLSILMQTVEEIMTRQILTITAQQPILDAAAQMLEHKIHCLPVIGEEGQLQGIITESDLFRMVTKKFF